MKPQGYCLIQMPPEDQQGGGIVSIYKSELKIEKQPAPQVTTMEIMEFMLIVNSVKACFIIIYHPSSSKVKQYSMTSFYKEFCELLAHYALTTEELIICGDFNFHVNDLSDDEATKFTNILDSFNLKQHITGATHRSGNTLDLLITGYKTILTGYKIDFQMSDHNVILCDLDIKKKSPCATKTVTFRKLKSINIESLKRDIENMVSKDCDFSNINSLITDYNANLQNVLDKHAPERQQKVAIRRPTPWMSQDIRPEKQKRRQLERKWRRTKIEADYKAFKVKKNKVNKILEESKSKYFSKLVSENASDAKGLFRIINATLNRK